MKWFIVICLLLAIFIPAYSLNIIGFQIHKPIIFPQVVQPSSNLGIQVERVMNATMSSSFSSSNEPKLGQWRWANDYWGSQDKFIHFLFYGWMNKELTDAFATWGWHGAKWKAAALTFITSGMNEVKDAYIPWELYGGVGGDGFSWWDWGFSTVGIAKAMFWPAVKKPKSQACSRPLKELWPRLGADGLILVGWVGGCATYHLIIDGKAFPHQSGEWQEIKGDQGDFVHVLFNFNTEISFIGPWYLNAQLRPYLPLGYRNIAILAVLGGNEVLNGYFREEDVPFIGDKGSSFGDVQAGIISMFAVDIYELILFPKNAVCEVGYEIVPTEHGLGLRFSW